MIRRLALSSLWPLGLAQGLALNRRIPRLPEAAGPRDGELGDAPSARLVVLGESTAVGVGTPEMARSLAPQLASALADASGQGWRWVAHGRTGLNAHRVREALCDELPDCELAVIILGVNDSLELTRLNRWRADLAALGERLREAWPEAPLVFAGVPPLGDFERLPWPLRALLGARARDLDLALRDWAREAGHLHCPTPAPRSREDFGEDGFHPSARGYQAWAGALAAAITAAGLTQRACAGARSAPAAPSPPVGRSSSA